MSLVADELNDLEMSTDDRQVFVDDTGDLSTTSGVRTVEQSLAISAGDVIRPLIGEPIDGQTLSDVEAELQERLSEDPQVTDIVSVTIDEINKSNGTVNVLVQTQFNNEYEISVTA